LFGEAVTVVPITLMCPGERESLGEALLGDENVSEKPPFDYFASCEN
jgi:hypothetical protein